MRKWLTRKTFRVPKCNTFRLRFRRVFTRYEALTVMRFSILYFSLGRHAFAKASGHLGGRFLPACLPAPVWAAISGVTVAKSPLHALSGSAKFLNECNGLFSPTIPSSLLNHKLTDVTLVTGAQRIGVYSGSPNGQAGRPTFTDRR